MSTKRFANGNRLSIETWRISLVLPGNAGRLHLTLNPRAYAGSGAFRDPHLLAWASAFADAHRAARGDGPGGTGEESGMTALATLTLDEMQIAVRRGRL